MIWSVKKTVGKRKNNFYINLLGSVSLGHDPKPYNKQLSELRYSGIKTEGAASLLEVIRCVVICSTTIEHKSLELNIDHFSSTCFLSRIWAEQMFKVPVLDNWWQTETGLR